MNQRSVLMAVLMAALACCGCNTFEHEWKRAADAPALGNDVQGRWRGVWISDVTAHTDELKCVIQRKPDGNYRARFHAKYHKVLSLGYTVVLKVRPDGDGFSFEGDADLGWYAGGVYHYEGRADTTNFHSTYSCKYDHGTFKMERANSGA